MRSTLDMALWDLKAKANGEPLWKTLGGSKQKIHCYASDIGLPMSDANLEAGIGAWPKITVFDTPNLRWA